MYFACFLAQSCVWKMLRTQISWVRKTAILIRPHDCHGSSQAPYLLWVGLFGEISNSVSLLADNRPHELRGHQHSQRDVRLHLRPGAQAGRARPRGSTGAKAPPASRWRTLWAGRLIRDVGHFQSIVLHHKSVQLLHRPGGQWSGISDSLTRCQQLTSTFLKFREDFFFPPSISTVENQQDSAGNHPINTFQTGPTWYRQQVNVSIVNMLVWSAPSIWKQLHPGLHQPF